MADSDVAMKLPLEAIACPNDCQDSRDQMCPVSVDVGSVLNILPSELIDAFYLAPVRDWVLTSGVEGNEYWKAETGKR